MRLAVGLAFRETSKAARNKWRGASRSFLARCRVSASAAAQRMAAAARPNGGRSRRKAIPSSPEDDAAGPVHVDCMFCAFRYQRPTLRNLCYWRGYHDEDLYN